MRKTLRSELMSQNPALYVAFERSTETAMKQWLPNIPQNKDSYNSYPHLLGVERHLDDILYREGAPVHLIKLNPTEIYVLLCAVLFHDMGRGMADASKVADASKDKEHSEYSQKLVNDNWAELGIISKRVAKVIGHICRFHDCNNQHDRDKLKDLYNIDCYEPIRGRKLGALLMLADMVDDTFLRVVPDYLFKDTDSMHIIGDYREKIQCVLVDYEKKMVRTVIDTDYLKKKDYLAVHKIEGALSNYLKKKCGPDIDGTIREVCALFVIASDVYHNSKELEEIRNDLNAMHIPLNAWMIECEDHLYKVTKYDKEKKAYITVEAVEQIIDYEYCRNVLKGILRLSGSSFGKTFHSYEKLLRYVREDVVNLNKIICTVKRLNILFRDNEEYSVRIHQDNVGWQLIDVKKNGDSQTNLWIEERDVEELFENLDKVLKEKVGKNNDKSE